MPIYEYSCPACGITFEEWVRSSGEADKTQACPKCGTEAPRMLSNTSFILKGEGWFASSYGNGTSNAFDKSNGVPPHGSKPAKEGSFRSRLLKRRAAQQQAEENEKMALQLRVATMEAERVQANRRAQIERIKQGLAPTQPIQLTPEEDAELEAAGVFKSEEERLQAAQAIEAEREQEPLLIQQEEGVQ